MGNLFQEFKRRKVIGALAIYAVVGWVVLQVVDVVADPLEIPLWVPRALIIAVFIGFPIVAGLSWFFDVTRLGLVRTSSVDGDDRKSIGGVSLSVVTLCVLGIAVLISREWDMNPEDSGSETMVMSLAVLPFDVLPSIEEPHLARLADELVDRLRANRQLRVASNDAVEALPSTGDLESQATQLGVRYILAGIIEDSGETIDLAIRLFDREADQEIWERMFQNAQLPVVNALIIDELFNFLGVAQPDAPRLTTNAKAYDLYLQGLQYWSVDEGDVRAEELFQAAIREDGRFSLPHAGLCQFYVEKYKDFEAPDDFETAERYCFRSLTLDDQSPEVHLAIGQIYDISGQFEKARDSYNNVLSMNPEHFGARLGLANTYTLENPDLTERMLTELVRDHPGSPSGYSSLQYLYFQLGRYEEAIEPARWSVRLSPNNEHFKFSLSADLFLAGMFSEAKTLLLSMLEEGAPRTGSVQSNLATVYFFEGDYGGAADLYRLALELGPDSPANARNLGDAIWHFQGKAEAEPIYKEVVQLAELQLEINPDNKDAMSALVIAFGSLGDEIQLESTLQKILSFTENDPYPHYDAAVAYSRIGNLEIAREHVIRARELGFPEALLKADPDIRLVGVEFENLDTAQTVN